MAEIHGVVYLIVGATIAIISVSLGPNMTFFVIAGILMSLFGVFKLAREYLDRETRFTKIPEEKQQYNCPGCGARMHPQFRFCPYCSYRLK
jgi:hypothetical protein